MDTKRSIFFDQLKPINVFFFSFMLLQAVSTRACYLFTRLVRVLRQNMRAFVREVLHSIQGHLVHIATHPPTEGAQGTSKAGGPGGAKITTMGAFLPATDDRYSVQLPVVHAVGWFLSQWSLWLLNWKVVLMLQHGTARHSTAQHSTAQHSTAQHSTAQHSTAQHSTAQHLIYTYTKLYHACDSDVPCLSDTTIASHLVTWYMLDTS